jgi:hypothetical protein
MNKQWISGFLYHVVIFNGDKSYVLCMDEVWQGFEKNRFKLEALEELKRNKMKLEYEN